ncbi:protein kinase [Cryptosporidium felis]|nr:protein kinase [Cryptosporidium felis]
MAVVVRKSINLSPKNSSKKKSALSSNNNSRTLRGRAKNRTLRETKHNHTQHPTKCLRGVSTRATFKRSPSPRRDWPFDEAVLYPPCSRSVSPRIKTRSSSSISRNRTHKETSRVNNLHDVISPIQFPTSNSPSPHHPHPTRCLRGVSTRATFKRSPSPRRDWPFDEAILYPPSIRSVSSKSPQKGRYAPEKKSPITKRKQIQVGKASSERKILNCSKFSNTKKSPVKSTKKNSGVDLKTENSAKVIHRYKVSPKTSLNALKTNYKTESIATVQDGEEEYIQSPVTAIHIGWGGNPLKNSYWPQRISGDNIIQISKGILWTEVHKGSSIWKPHKCINDFRLVSHSKDLYNPYPGSSKLQVAEYIWEFKNLSELVSYKNQKFPALFELLFVRKDSLLSSILGKFYGNSMSHEVIYRELLSQSVVRYHPNFVRINEVIEEDSFPFSVFVMEYLPHSSMTWNPATQLYQAPSIYPIKGAYNKVYTFHGLKLIFLQVLEAIKFIHSKGIAGIYLRPDSVKISHSLDETYKDKDNHELTRLVFDDPLDHGRIEKEENIRDSKIEVDSELSKYWDLSESIHISGQQDLASIKKINEIIQAKKSQSPNLQKYSLLFKTEPFIEDLQNFYEKEYIKINNENNKGLLIKLSSPFKGMGTGHKEHLFSGNKWLSPPELYSRMFNSVNSEVDLRKCDIWNLGVLLHCLSTGKPPNQVGNRVILDRSVPREIKSLLLLLLNVDPILRPSTYEIQNYIGSWGTLNIYPNNKKR